MSSIGFKKLLVACSGCEEWFSVGYVSRLKTIVDELVSFSLQRLPCFSFKAILKRHQKHV